MDADIALQFCPYTTKKCVQLRDEIQNHVLVKGDFRSAAWLGVYWMYVWRGEGKGAQPPMMLFSVLMMLSRCLTL